MTTPTRKRRWDECAGATSAAAGTQPQAKRQRTEGERKDEGETKAPQLRLLRDPSLDRKGDFDMGLSSLTRLGMIKLPAKPPSSWPDIYIVTGHRGAGKSTVCRAINIIANRAGVTPYTRLHYSTELMMAARQLFGLTSDAGDSGTGRARPIKQLLCDPSRTFPRAVDRMAATLRPAAKAMNNTTIDPDSDAVLLALATWLNFGQGKTAFATDAIGFAGMQRLDELGFKWDVARTTLPTVADALSILDQKIFRAVLAPDVWDEMMMAEVSCLAAKAAAASTPLRVQIEANFYDGMTRPPGLGARALVERLRAEFKDTVRVFAMHLENPLVSDEHRGKTIPPRHAYEAQTVIVDADAVLRGSPKGAPGDPVASWPSAADVSDKQLVYSAQLDLCVPVVVVAAETKKTTKGSGSASGSGSGSGSDSASSGSSGSVSSGSSEMPPPAARPPRTTGQDPVADKWPTIVLIATDDGGEMDDKTRVDFLRGLRRHMQDNVFTGRRGRVIYSHWLKQDIVEALRALNDCTLPNNVSGLEEDLCARLEQPLPTQFAFPSDEDKKSSSPPTSFPLSRMANVVHMLTGRSLDAARDPLDSLEGRELLFLTASWINIVQGRTGYAESLLGDADLRALDALGFKWREASDAPISQGVAMEKLTALMSNVSSDYDHSAHFFQYHATKVDLDMSAQIVFGAEFAGDLDIAYHETWTMDARKKRLRGDIVAASVKIKLRPRRGGGDMAEQKLKDDIKDVCVRLQTDMTCDGCRRTGKQPHECTHVDYLDPEWNATRNVGAAGGDARDNNKDDSPETADEIADSAFSTVVDAADTRDGQEIAKRVIRAIQTRLQTFPHIFKPGGSC